MTTKKIVFTLLQAVVAHASVRALPARAGVGGWGGWLCVNANTA